MVINICLFSINNQPMVQSTNLEVRGSDVDRKNGYSNILRDFHHYLPCRPVLGLQIKISKSVSSALFLMALFTDDNIT
jgi:hypothetical protein